MMRVSRSGFGGEAQYRRCLMGITVVGEVMKNEREERLIKDIAISILGRFARIDRKLKSCRERPALTNECVCVSV